MEHIEWKRDKEEIREDTQRVIKGRRTSRLDPSKELGTIRRD